MIRFRRDSTAGSGTGMAERSACVYGCWGILYSDSLSSSYSFLPHKFQDNPVYTGVFEPAFFQILAASKCAQRFACHLVIRTVDTASVVTAHRQQLLHFPCHRLVNL